MQILYVTTMVAIFVLCLALFSIGRRILQSPRFSNGELSLIRLEGAIHPYGSNVEADGADTATLPLELEDEDTEHGPILEDLILSSEEDLVLSPIAAATAVELPFQPPIEASAPAPQESVSNQRIEEPEPPARPEARPERKRSKAVPRAYHHALECLLLGVSIFVLVRTQRSTARYRSSQSADQVA